MAVRTKRKPHQQVMTPARLAVLASGGKWRPARHLLHVNRHLLHLAASRIRRLQVGMPPRHGKSWQCARWFPAWYIMTYPEREVLICTASDSLAARHSEYVRDIIERYGPELAGIRVRPSHRAQADWEIVDIHGRPTGGRCRGAGVGTSILGDGASLLVLDDLYGSITKVVSPAYRDAVHRWCVQTAFSRLSPDGVVLSIGSRQHSDDIYGRFELAEADGGELWQRINLPAIAEEDDPLGRSPGEALWPELYPLEKLLAIKADKEANGRKSDWLANYCLRPSAGDGTSTWPDEYFHEQIWFVDRPDFSGREQRILSIDTSGGKRITSDFAALVWADWMRSGHFYIDAELCRLDIERLYQRTVEIITRESPNVTVVETNGLGQVLFDRLSKTKINGMFVPVLGRYHGSEGELAAKELRISARLTPQLARGTLHFAKTPGARLLVKQLKEFPNSDYDDACDALELNLELAGQLLLPAAKRTVKYEMPSRV